MIDWEDGLFNWQKDFSYWYINENNEIVEVSSLGEVPEVREYGKISDAVWYFPQLSMRGKSAHTLDGAEHRLYLHIMREAVKKHGEEIQIYRGHRGEWAIEDHKILYGSPDRSVAAHYGAIVETMNVKGLLTKSPTFSVASDDEFDFEVIFFPETIIYA